MMKFLQFLGILLLVILFVGTGQLLSFQLGRFNLWQLFWVGVIIWLWGYVILIRVREKEKASSEKEPLKDPYLIEQKQELEKIKVAAISALIAITFFYFSISWIFQDDLLISGLVLLVTFIVSLQLQNQILKKGSQED